MPKPELKQLPIEKLHRGEYQPRRRFEPESLAELAQSIQSNGLIQPIVVRPSAAGQYEIIAGERRWRACQLAGLDSIACLINGYSDEQAAEVAAVENLNRVDLNPIEEAQAYQRLIAEFGYIHEEVAAAIGKSRTKITNALRLLKLAPEVQELLIAGELSEGHGKILAGIDAAKQRELASKCVKQGWSVRKLEQAARRQTEAKTAANTDLDKQALENALAEHVGCKVAIDYDAGKGKLQIDFHSLEILQGLFSKMGFEYE